MYTQGVFRFIGIELFEWKCMLGYFQTEDEPIMSESNTNFEPGVILNNWDHSLVIMNRGFMSKLLYLGRSRLVS